MTDRRTGVSGRPRAVIAALAANIGVGIAKLVGFLVTGSASLLAEAIHSVADSTNETLLLFGTSRSRRRARPSHPFGYGRERYFWSFVVAIVLFTGGGLFALVEAEEKLRRPHELTSLAWAVGVLLLGMGFEGYSLRTAVRRAGARKRDSESWFGFVRRSREPELTVVLLEDFGALLGLAFAMVGVVLAVATGNARFDAIGSLAIGLLLVSIALLLAGEMKSFLIGESASRSDVSSIRHALQSDVRVARVVALRTEQVGPDDIIVTAELELRTGMMSGDEVPEALRQLERAVSEAVPATRFIALQPVPRSGTRALPSGSSMRRSPEEPAPSVDLPAGERRRPNRGLTSNGRC